MALSKSENGTAKVVTGGICPLSVRDARRSFGGNIALAGVSFELGRNEMLGLLGPNGAGKTTLIRAICGRIRLDSGSVQLSGKPVENSSASTLIGFVPQENAIYPQLSARQNLDVFGRLHGLAGDQLRSRIEEVLDWIGLRDRADEPTVGFSGGMKRRVNIACGILHRPSVVLLDEPTVGIDPQSRERIYDMLDELRQQGASILLTTHQLIDVENRCDRIVILDHGKVIGAGTLTELIHSTIGRQRRATFQIAPSDSVVPEGFSQTSVDNVIAADLMDVGADLSDCLSRLHNAGIEVLDVDFTRPDLQSVFLHLTGRELRE